MSENYDDDSVWETYVPETMYSEGAYRNRSDLSFRRNGWLFQGEWDTSYDPPRNDLFIYRRRKQANPEPADDGPKFETRVTGLTVYDSGVCLFQLGSDTLPEVTVIQCGTNNRIRVSDEQWPALRAAIDRLIGECRE